MIRISSTRHSIIKIKKTVHEDCHKEYVSLHLVQWVRRNRSGRTNTQMEGQTSKRTDRQTIQKLYDSTFIRVRGGGRGRKSNNR